MPTKYQLFEDFLTNLPPSKNSISLSFEELEKILGFSLPKRSVEHVAWWSNSLSHPLAKVWLENGWQSENPSQIITSKRITLKRIGKAPVRIKKEKSLKETIDKPVINPLQVKVLLESGFSKVCCWTLEESGIKLSDKIENKPGVYAFVINDIAVYVGVASRSLSKRLRFYSKPGVTQRTSIRIGALLKAELEKGVSVDIFIACPEHSKWNDLPVDTISGLEAGLIAHYKPVWNKRGL